MGNIFLRKNNVRVTMTPTAGLVLYNYVNYILVLY